MGFTYKELASFCSLFVNIVASRKFTWFCEPFISNLIVGLCGQIMNYDESFPQRWCFVTSCTVQILFSILVINILA